MELNKKEIKTILNYVDKYKDNPNSSTFLTIQNQNFVLEKDKIDGINSRNCSNCALYDICFLSRYNHVCFCFGNDTKKLYSQIHFKKR